MGVLNEKRCKALHSFKQGSKSHQAFSLKVAAQLALMAATEGVATYDTHGNNVMGLTDDTRSYSDNTKLFDDSKNFIYDFGGVFDLKESEADKNRLIDLFDKLCQLAHHSSSAATFNSKSIVAAMPSEEKTVEATLLQNGICIQDLCNFFGLRVPLSPAEIKPSIAELSSSFNTEVHHCFTMFHKKAGKNQQLDVHRRLMMIAFIDFMYNRLHEHPYCQCGEILEDVYPGQKGPNQTIVGIKINTFKDFRSFLTIFNLKELPEKHCLEEVVMHIKDILTPRKRITEQLQKDLPSRHTRKRLRDDSPNSSKKSRHHHGYTTEEQSLQASQRLDNPSFLRRLWDKIKTPWNKGGTRKINGIRNRKSSRNSKI